MASLYQTKTTVLVVDDEELVRVIAVDMLQDAGFSVLEAPSGPDALAVLADHPEVAVVFSDINMPGAFDGLELAERVHLLRPDVHFILTSGRAAPDTTELADSEFVAKPYHYALVTSLIRGAVVRAISNQDTFR